MIEYSSVWHTYSEAIGVSYGNNSLSTLRTWIGPMLLITQIFGVALKNFVCCDRNVRSGYRILIIHAIFHAKTIGLRYSIFTHTITKAKDIISNINNSDSICMY